MKVLITTTGPTLADELDLRFGRARHAIVVDTQTGAASAHDRTPVLNSPQGAGIQAAQAAVDLGAEAILTGNVGPKAFRALQAAGIPVYLCPPGQAAEALEQFKAGTLEPAGGASMEAHGV